MVAAGKKKSKVVFVDSDGDEGEEAEPVHKRDLKAVDRLKETQTKVAACKQSIHSDAQAKKAELAEEKQKSVLHAKIGGLEAGLAAALSAYRREAEEVLATHLREMEALQSAHDLEVSILRGENFILREKLGFKPGESSAETILFQTQAQPEPDDKKKKKNKKGKHSDDDDDDEGSRRPKKAWGDDEDNGFNVKNYKTGKAAKQQDVPAGTWQPFVAWIPNGSALGRPEPWKPLTAQDMELMRSHSNLKHQKGASSPKRQDAAQSPTSVLPHMIEDKAKDKDGDSDDDSNKSSDLDEGGKMYLLDVWQASKTQKNRMNRGSGMGDTESSSPFREEEEAFPAQERPPYILNPDSNMRISWDLASVFMVVYDAIMIPMTPFELEGEAFPQFMDWVTRIFWTMDIGWSCCTGLVLADGSVEYRMNVILKRYAKTWLALDVFIVSSDYTTLFFTAEGTSLIELGRVFRIARVVRLLRLVRMQEIIANITERIQSDTILLALQILKHFVVALYISHVIACCWWGIGSLSKDNPQVSQAWVEAYATTGTTRKYLVSLHWAISQLSGGMDEVTPMNTLERFYAVVVAISAFMVAVVMLSTLTSSLTQQYIIGGSGARQMANLKKYLKQNYCPKNLTKRVCRNAKHAISGDLTADAVELLNVISEPLKIEMHYEMYSRILYRHPFFLELLAGPHHQLCRWVCHRAMSILLLALGDVVFSRGEEPSEPKMYFVASGSLEYLDGYGETTMIVERQWLAEAALWTNWRHRGTLTAQSDVKMALLDSQLFQDICKRHFRKAKDAALYIKQYAESFIEELNLESNNATDLPIGGAGV
eukprot:TRINITY_DN4298_c0_g2_i1.p1 TRINITY_DN4298_c0_g2~~TRINITY_DN4298_c0_g2_i1.p1  ORF type:complete len:824 (+),score=173.04 TRINITY_DN4298_c0_g2_i1:63-2534(+)